MTSTLLQQAVEKALRRAFQLGQIYWQQADSESRAQNRQAEITQSKFDTLIAETLSALQQQPEPVALSDKQIQDAVFAVLRRWKDDRAWDRYTRESGPYDVSSLRPEVLEIIRAVLAIAPPALQQQEEPREVAGTAAIHLTADEIASLMMDLSDHDGRDFEPECPSCTAFRKLSLACVAASPSPQDFTLLMVEEGKGTDGVGGTDGR